MQTLQDAVIETERFDLLVDSREVRACGVEGFHAPPQVGQQRLEVPGHHVDAKQENTGVPQAVASGEQPAGRDLVRLFDEPPGGQNAGCFPHRGAACRLDVSERHRRARWGHAEGEHLALGGVFGAQFDRLPQTVAVLNEVVRRKDAHHLAALAPQAEQAAQQRDGRRRAAAERLVNHLCVRQAKLPACLARVRLQRLHGHRPWVAQRQQPFERFQVQGLVEQVAKRLWPRRPRHRPQPRPTSSRQNNGYHG